MTFIVVTAGNMLSIPTIRRFWIGKILRYE